jgi:spermidine synthase
LRICLTGLGGGALAKYCDRLWFDVTIEAVEIDPEGIALRDVFRMPAGDARLRVMCADGADAGLCGRARVAPGRPAFEGR